MLLELNSQFFDYMQGFSNIPYIGYIADLPIFFLPTFLAWMWIYYTFFQEKNTNLLSKIKDKFSSNETFYTAKRLDLLHIFYACILGLVFSYIIKLFVDIDRPDTYLEQTWNLIMSTIPAKSFPSDHATVSFAFTISLFFAGFKKVGYIFLPFVIIMNISRIIAWVHWPLDILAGTIVGISAAIITFKYIVPLKLVKSGDILIIGIMKKLRLY